MSGAAVLLAAAVLLLLAPPTLPDAAWSPPPAAAGGSADRMLGRMTGRRLILLSVAAGAVVLPRLAAAHVVVATAAAMSVVAVLRLAADRRATAAADRRRAQLVSFTEELLGQLRSGRPVEEALTRSAEVWAEAEPAATAARLGADVPAALRQVAALPGGSGAGRLAAAWVICASTGSGLSLATERMLATARAEQVTARLVRSELASAHATARLVVVLPVVVQLASHGLGADPWHFLLDTVPGSLCLAAGAALSLLGLAWIDRIARSALSGTS